MVAKPINKQKLKHRDRRVINNKITDEGFKGVNASVKFLDTNRTGKVDVIDLDDINYIIILMGVCMKEELSEFLKQNKLLPYTNNDKWNVFKIEHTGALLYGSVAKSINSEFRNLLGVYIYEKQGIVYYVGEGVLKGRIRQHYSESYKETKREKHARWYKFFLRI